MIPLSLKEYKLTLTLKDCNLFIELSCILRGAVKPAFTLELVFQLHEKPFADCNDTSWVTAECYSMTVTSFRSLRKHFVPFVLGQLNKF